MPVMIKSDARAREKPCLRCGTSLRRIVDVTHCPTCGLSIWLSLNSIDSLESSNPPWQRQLAVGALIMAGSQLLGLIACGLVWLPSTNLLLIVAAPLLVGGAYFILYHLGALIMSRHEQRYPDRLGTVRNALRIVAIANIVMGALMLAVGTAIWFHSRATLLATLPLAGLLVEVAAAASLIATLVYVRRLARRVPSSKVARLCGYMLFLPILSVLKFFPAVGLLLIPFRHIVPLLPFAYLPLTAGIFIWLAIALKRASVHADAHWKAETQPPRQAQAAPPSAAVAR